MSSSNLQRAKLTPNYLLSDFKKTIVSPVAVVRAIRIIAVVILIRIQPRPGSKVGRRVRGLVEPPDALLVLEAEEASNGLPHCKDGGEDVDEVT